MKTPEQHLDPFTAGTETTLGAKSPAQSAVANGLVITALARLERSLQEAITEASSTPADDLVWIRDELRYRLTKELPARLRASELAWSEEVGFIEDARERAVARISSGAAVPEQVLATGDAIEHFLDSHGCLAPNFFSDPRHYDH